MSLRLRVALVVAATVAVAAASTGIATATPTGPERRHTMTTRPVHRHAAVSTTFRNPLNPGPDPFMTWYQGYYYLSTTQGDAIRIWKARSLNQLLAAPATTVWTDTDPSRNKQLWAPEFSLVDGHWYVYYTADDGVDDHHRLYVLESSGTDPLGPYHLKAKLVPPGLDQWAIDPSLLRLGGRLYLGFSSIAAAGHNSLYLAPMSDPWTVSGPAVYLPAAGCASDTVREAPEFLHHGSTTYLVYSSCDTGKPDYQLWMKSLSDGKDPMVASNWVQHDGPVFGRNDSTGVYGPGHNGFFTSPDGSQTWIVYGAKNTANYTYEGRTTRAQRITFRADGSPDFGVPLAAGATQALPSGDPGSTQYWINDDNRSSGTGSVTYAGAWSSGSGCGTQCFWGDDHWTGNAGDTATFTFTGTRIALLSVRDTNYGLAAVSVDGGAETTIDLYSANRTGEQLNYLSPALSPGTHTLRVRNTGQRNASSTGTLVEIDRAEVYG
ncbi:family 43 glycosylhydrolase [Actinocatenispora rupis]|uniref:Hydrolase n=1 Tax=Actinocatenispora rupis TaxID=519421 RepID=A0A8J3JCP3_9ACTN|nr:family 43 glycosylhydrolase [Actinocatenispora rupis]GID16022.1 hydrolase [Actinocatenispora rupis]